MQSPLIMFDQDGTVVRVLVSSRETEGRYTICEMRTTGRIVLAAHLNLYEDRWYQVLTGHYQFDLGHQVIAGGPGTAVFIPRETILKVTSATEGAGSLLIVAHPGGLDLFFGDAQAAQRTGADPELLRKVLEKHGITFIQE
jgi:mannose-6-phosphate isomerase-like protein (cupin superfamily)